MSTCSAAEIAEKKRIALNKLQAKKNQLLNNGVSMTARPVATTSSRSVASSPGTSRSLVHNGPIKSFYKSNTENKAADFLHAVKQSTTFANRSDVKDLNHPYQKASIKTVQYSPGKSVFKDALSPQNNTTKSPPFLNPINCTCYLVSNIRFAVQTSGYHDQLIQVFKSIPSKSYDHHTRTWSFAVKDYEMVQERVAGLKPKVVIGTIPKNVLKLSSTPIKDLDPSCLALIEPKLVNNLLPFQKEGVMFGISKHGRVMICDEMGLGKTYQALAIADFYKDDWPLFICTTASTRNTWSMHVLSLLPKILVHQVSILTTKQQYTGDAKVLITSYNLMEKCAEMLLEKKFGILILDESHTLKNSKAKCTVVADRMAQQARRVILLSGTPALSRPVELFSQIQMIDRRFLNFMEYTTRYCAGKQTNFGWDATGQSNLQELKAILKMKFMVRRVKADVLPELAEKQRETVVLDPSLIWNGSSMQTTFKSYADDLSRTRGKEKEGILLRYYTETAIAKTRAVCEYLKMLIKENLKFIVFAHHKVMMDAICDSFDKQKVKYVRIDGSTKNELRNEYVETFQNKYSCRAAVLSLKACNSGITLTAAQTIVFAELDWNPSTLAQAECRAHRIGQTSLVTCRYLLASGTADDVIWNMLKEKQDVLNKAGIFAGDLRDATAKAGPVSSKSIESYMTPVKKKKEAELDSSSPSLPPVKKMNEAELKSNKNVVPEAHTNEIKLEINKSLIDSANSLDIELDFSNMFDEDDDAFKDLVF